jgi:bifunctional ADP-heptose synthase (sugar kinase/adenylyltransferase)
MNKHRATKPLLKLEDEDAEGLNLKNEYRNLKIQFNICQDENTRLKTRLAALNQSQLRMEKELSNKITPFNKKSNDIVMVQ